MPDTGEHTDPDRGRGILTPRDREYLLGERTYDGQHERNVRMDIRERARHGLFDFILLVEEMDPRDLNQVLDQLDERNLRRTREALHFAAEYVTIKLETEEASDSLIQTFRTNEGSVADALERVREHHSTTVGDEATAGADRADQDEPDDDPSK